MASDDLVASDLTQAIVLAGVRHEEITTSFDEGPKRKSRWSELKVSKKGKRWGLPDDKPYKPLPYVDLPMGLSEKEIDQFLREQRLEDLHRKIQGHELEDIDPDIRAPSPPPVYDKAGNRLNTRDIRIRKSMTAEYNRLIRYMIKHVDGYLPPVDWKPARLMKKIIIPIEKFPQAPFMGVVIGPRGVNHKRLQETTGCKIFIRGRDIGDKWQSDEEAAMPQHVHIEGETEEQILTAERLIEPLLNPESPEFEYARTHGMQQLAMVNGFTLNKAEQRCGICGALGHLGFECPETNNQNYKMANVTCSICGDKGHVAADCKKAQEKHQRDNVDWKDMAEKKAQMDKDFSDMMGEMHSGPPGGGVMATTGTAGPSGAPSAKMQGAPPAGPGGLTPGGNNPVDRSVVCPAHLVSKLIGPGGLTLKKIAQDSGAQINLDGGIQPGGGKTIIITAPDAATRERAKAELQNWLQQNGGMAQPQQGMGMAMGGQMPQRPAMGAMRPGLQAGGGCGGFNMGGGGGCGGGGCGGCGGCGGMAPNMRPPMGQPMGVGLANMGGMGGGCGMGGCGMGGKGMGGMQGFQLPNQPQGFMMNQGMPKQQASPNMGGWEDQGPMY